MDVVVEIGNIDDHRCAVLVHLLLDGERAKVLCLVVGNLLAIHCEALCEVAVAIEETNGTHIDIGVGCFLDVVAGKHTQTAAVDLQGRVDAVLHAEVGYRGTCVVGLHIHILTE